MSGRHGTSARMRRDRKRSGIYDTFVGTEGSRLRTTPASQEEAIRQFARQMRKGR